MEQSEAMECDGTSNASPKDAASKWVGSMTQSQLEMRQAMVQAELSRVSKLPSNSSYAIHRVRLLNKLLRLLSVPRTVPEDEELELLFATLSL